METRDPIEVVMDEIEMVLQNTERFPEDGQEEDNDGRKMLPQNDHSNREGPQNEQDQDSEGKQEDGPQTGRKSFKRPYQCDSTDFVISGREDYGKMSAADFWALLERDLKLTDIDGEDFRTVQMPKYTIETFKAILASSLAYDTKRGFYMFGSDQLSSEENETIDKFLRVVSSTRLLAINTEGHRFLHPCRTDDQGQPMPLVIVVLANLSGTILCFPDALQMPRKLLEVIEDISVYKIGSGLKREFEELERINIKIKGWAESGALYHAFLKKEVRTGLKAQCEFLNEFEPSKGLFRYFAYSRSWEKMFKKGSPRYIPWASYPHISMNVRVPIAVFCATAVKFAQDRQLSDDTLAFPIAWEGLDLVRAKSGEDLHDVSSDVQDNWIAKMPGESSYPRHQRLQNCRELTYIRRAQADFVEVFEKYYDPSLKSAEAHGMYVDPQGELLRLPPRKVGVSGRVREYLANCCAYCGLGSHHIGVCPQVVAGAEVTCRYEHDGVLSLAPHAVRTCPILHNYCSICFMRGHHPDAHQVRRFTQRELRERFLQNQPRGLLTSILLLATCSEGLEAVVSPSWRFGLLAQSFRRDAISRHHLQIPSGTKLGSDPERVEKEGEARRNALLQKIKAVERNTQITDPRNAISVPRFLIREYTESVQSSVAEAQCSKNIDKRHPVWGRLGSRANSAGVNTPKERHQVYRPDLDYHPDDHPEDGFLTEENSLMAVSMSYIYEEDVYDSNGELVYDSNGEPSTRKVRLVETEEDMMSYRPGIFDQL